jgi:hypothetical protein
MSGKFTVDSGKMKKLLLSNLPYGIIFIIVLQVIGQLPFEIPLPVPDIVIALAASILIRVVVYFRGKNAKKYRKNIEYGSARWGA